MSCLSSDPSPVLSPILNILPDIKITPTAELSLLGSPVSNQSVPSALASAKVVVEGMCERIQYLDSHTALYMLTHHTSAPRLSYLLRTAPTYLFPEQLSLLDRVVQDTATNATNTCLAEDTWRQASLPVRYGGIGLRDLRSLALPCYLSSLHSSLDLRRSLLPNSSADQPLALVNATLAFTESYPGADLPAGETACSQREWDGTVCEVRRDQLLDECSQVHRARLLAACAPHSGAWLQAVPLRSLGLHLDDETVRIAVGLRLGAKVCEPHRCRCGSQVGALGHHGLSCRFSAGRFPRHANLNDVVKRGLAAAGVPSCLEPLGLDRGDGKRPDGLTVFPFSGGRSLCWDATCVDSFCQSSLTDCALQPGAAADAAEARKRVHYRSIATRYRFEPLAVETTGVFGRSSAKFVAELGRRISATTGHRRELEWLRQRLSVAVVRGNAAAVLASGRMASMLI